MKTIGTKLRAVVILMLALVMLATAGLTTAFAIDASTGGNAGVAAAPDDTGKIENLTGWFDITSGPDGVKVTLTPDKEALKGVSKEQIKSLAASLVDAIKELVKDDVVDSVIGDASLTDEDFFKTVLDKYIEGKYADQLEFFKAVVNDADVEVEFISYVCETLLANSIRFGVLASKDVPTADEISKAATDYFCSLVNENAGVDFGMSYDDLVGEGGRISDIVVAFKVSYDKALETKPFTKKDIFTLLESVKIGEYGDVLHTVYGKKDGESGPHIYVDSIKALLKTVPTHTELLEMTSDTLSLSYTLSVKIKGFENPVEFTVTLELAGSSLSYIQRGIQVIVDHVDFNIESDGAITVSVQMPEIFTDALLKACNSGRIPESLKDKVFTALTATPDDAYALFADLEYGEILTLIEKVDFNDILNKEKVVKYRDFINKYIPEIDLENLETEDVIAKLEEYAGHFNKLKNYVAKAYSYVPDRVKDESVSSFYEGNGIFGYEATVERFDLAPIIYEVVARFNEDYALNVSNLLDKTVIENLSLDLSISFFDIYEVEFYKPGETEPYRTGFLPVGATLETFAQLSEVDGYKVDGWYELLSNGEIGAELKTMPARDVKIVADLDITEIEFEKIEINSSGITLQGGVFTGSPITPTVNVTGNEYYTVTVEAEPKTNAGKGYTAKVILAVKDEYKDTHKLVVDGGEECSTFTVEGLTWDIEKQTIYVTPVGLTTAGKFTYTGEDITVEMASPAVDADKIICKASGTLGRNVGEYYATMVLTLAEAYRGNCVISFENVPDGITAGSFDEATESASYTVKWDIEKRTIYVTPVGLTTAGKFTYTGADITVGMTSPAVDADKIICQAVADTLIGRSAGEYYAQMVLTVAEAHKGNCVISFENVPDGITAGSFDEATGSASYTVKWVIEPLKIEINSSDITLQGGVFTGSPITPTASVTGNEFYTVTVEAEPKTNAGKGYTAKVILAVKDEHKNSLSLVVDGGEPCSEFTIEGLTWDIERMTIYVTPVGLTTASGFIYTGENITVEMTSPAVDADKIICQAAADTLVGRSAGEYYAQMVLTLAEAYKGNYVISFENVPDGITAGSFDEATESASYTVKWVIAPQEIDLEGGLDWTLDFTFAFGQDGTSGIVHTPSYVFAGNNNALEFVLGGTTSASEPGEYTITLGVTLKDPANYKFKDSDEITVSLEKTWKINKINLDVSGITAADKIVDYDGSYYSFSIYDVVIPEELLGKIEVSMPHHSYREIGVYSVKFTATVKDAQHYTIDGETEVELFTKTLTIRGSFVTDMPIRVNGEEIGTITSVNGIPSTYNMVAIDVSHLYGKAPLGAELAAKYPGMYAKVLLAYDFSFVDADGDTRTLFDEFTLTLDGVAGMFTNPNVIVVYIDENGNVAEEFLHSIDGNDVSFTTNHFSAYAIVEIVPEEQEKDGFPWWIILIIVLAVAIIAVIIIIIVKKKSGKPTEDPTEPTADTPVDEAPETTEATPIEEPIEEAPVEEPVEEAPVEEPVEEAPVEEPVEEAPVEEPVEEAPAEEPVEEAPAEEPVEEAPAEEPVEEAPVTEVPEVVAAEPEKKSEDGEAFGQRIINGQVVLVSYRSSYMSRLIQADTEIQDYYTVIKNTLLSYKGVKSRISWNFESFNKGRIQCVKLNLKGRALLVYIGLEPSEYNANKYHFTDVSDKPKFEKVPMLMKVKSDRGLKYALELIDEMMRKLEIPQGEMPNEDYHMPYETTEALVERDLVKVILPPGVTLDENSSIEKIDVSELIENANANKADDTAEAPTEEPAAEATEEPAVEEAVVEEAVVEEPVAETVEAPAAEHENEVHVDAVHADELLTDTEAEAQIEVIERTSLMTSTKMAEINLDTICDNYEDDETVDINSLKAKRLVNKNAGRIKVLARGVMTKRLVIIADKFSLQAVKMITLAGGHAEQLK